MFEHEADCRRILFGEFEFPTAAEILRAANQEAIAAWDACEDELAETGDFWRDPLAVKCWNYNRLVRQVEHFIVYGVVPCEED